MTDQPRISRVAVTPAATDDFTITWINRAEVGPAYRKAISRRRGSCWQCGAMTPWRVSWEPLLCTFHHSLAAFAALPWWRRAFTRKPKP